MNHADRYRLYRSLAVVALILACFLAGLAGGVCGSGYHPGPVGHVGQPGPPGPQGIPGSQGAPGRDAVAPTPDVPVLGGDPHSGALP